MNRLHGRHLLYSNHVEAIHLNHVQMKRFSSVGCELDDLQACDSQALQWQEQIVSGLSARSVPEFYSIRFLL
jgi:hypothetical protein